VRTLTIGICACVLLSACSTNIGASDPVATKAAENQYSVCLSNAAARLDDGRSEAAAIGNAVAGACYPQFRQIQAADGDEEREQWLGEHAPQNAASMHNQDLTQQTILATRAVLVHRQQNYEAQESTSSAEGGGGASAAEAQ